MKLTTRMPKIDPEKVSPEIAQLLSIIELQIKEIQLLKDEIARLKEKDQILTTGLKISGHINVDDTGARHNGANGYCTHIGNDLFAWFKSSESKSRINFLNLLQDHHNDYIIKDIRPS